MSRWQQLVVDRLRSREPSIEVTPYGSWVDHSVDVDGWSDLDVELYLTSSTEAGELFDGVLWAWQETVEGQDQVVRLVLQDGRRIDVRVRGAGLLLPADPPADLSVRFDAALAASRLGRGAELVGLHLLLGILREALVQQMLLADQAAGSRHHRGATPQNAQAEVAAEVLSGSLGPETVLTACALYGRWRAAVESSYTADWSGLRAVIRRGTHPTR